MEYIIDWSNAILNPSSGVIRDNDKWRSGFSIFIKDLYIGWIDYDLIEFGVWQVTGFEVYNLSENEREFIKLRMC